MVMFVVFGLPVRANVVILLKRCGRRQLLNDHRPMNSSGMVTHNIICRLERVLNTPRSFSLKLLKKQAAGVIFRQTGGTHPENI
jgi:hypothetical protein